MKRLFIAEKPSVAKAIFEALGGSPTAKMIDARYTIGNDTITSLFGHAIRVNEPHEYDEKYKVWRLEDLPIKSVYPPTFQPIEESKLRLEQIKTMIDSTDVIVGATDRDAAGQIILDELITYLKYSKPVLRILISDMNIKPVQKALDNLEPNEKYKNLGLSELARAIGDQLFGFNLTRAYSLKARDSGFNSVIPIGRVQSAVLGLVNSRTLLNKNHDESFFYEIISNYQIGSESFNAKYQATENDIIDEKKRIIDLDNAKEITSNCVDTGTISNISSKPLKTPPPMPFNLSAIQQVSAKKWGYSASETLGIVQELYDQFHLVTYPRSDCRYLSEEHFSNRKEVLNALKRGMPGFSNIIDNADIDIKHKAFNTNKITAHHAICPTEKSRENCNLNEKQKNIYELIANSFIGLFYSDSVREKTRLSIINNGNEFIATQSNLVSRGWEVLSKADIESEQINGVDLRALTVNQVVNISSTDIQSKKTTPPKYFVESTLLAAMTKAAKEIKDPNLRKILELKDENNSAECGSIGTEATRAGILEKLKENTGLLNIVDEKGYKEKVWKTTTQGQELCSILPDEIVAPDTSAIWSEKTQLIAEGKLSVEEFLSFIDDYLKVQVADVKDKGFKITPNMESCPKCNDGFIGQRKGSNGVFWACNKHPKCLITFPDKNGKPDLTAKQKRAPIVSNFKCPQCEKGLIRKKSKKKVKGNVSYFWSCSSYPECEILIPDKAGKPNYDKAKLPEKNTK